MNGDRPVTRAECEHAERPCPFVTCHYHLALNVPRKTRGRVQPTWKWWARPKLREAWKALQAGAIDDERFSDLLVEELAAMPATCALDVADNGGASQEEIAAIYDCKHQQISHTETVACRLPVLRNLGRADSRSEGDGLTYAGSPDDYIRDEPASLTIYQQLNKGAAC